MMVSDFELENISDERVSRLALSYAVPVQNELTHYFLRHGSAVRALRIAADEEAATGVDPKRVGLWLQYFENYDPATVARGLDLAQEHDLQMLIPGDKDWPTGIPTFGDLTPYALWVKGARPELLTREITERATITGARAASGRGMYDADQLAVGLALRDVTVVATSAPGIARAALAGAVGGPGGAIAVMPHGLDDPNAHTPNGFFDSVAENGMRNPARLVRGARHHAGPAQTDREPVSRDHRRRVRYARRACGGGAHREIAESGDWRGGRPRGLGRQPRPPYAPRPA